jgi:hypothetical protein
MSNFDVVRDQIYEEVNRGGERVKVNLPNWIERAIEAESWRQAVNVTTGKPYQNLGEWLVARWPMGPAVGSTSHSITYDELIMLCDRRPVIKDLLVKHRPSKGKGGRPKKDAEKPVDNVNGFAKKPSGNSRAYIERRLQFDHPEIWQAYLNGEHKSARQAGIAAGFIKDTHDPLALLKANWSKATGKQRKQFLKWIESDQQ